jgi:hypothetical protein
MASLKLGLSQWSFDPGLDRFKNGRPRTEALTHKRKNTINGWEPVWLMIAVARATQIEQVSAIVSRE